MLSTPKQTNDLFTLEASSKQPSIVITKPSQNGMGTDLVTQITSHLSKGDVDLGVLNRNDDIFWLSDTPIPEKPLSSAMSPICPCRSQCPNYELSNPSSWWIHKEDSPKFENFTESLWQTFETSNNGSKSKTFQFSGLRRDISLSVFSLSNKGRALQSSLILGSSTKVISFYFQDWLTWMQRSSVWELRFKSRGNSPSDAKWVRTSPLTFMSKMLEQLLKSCTWRWLRRGDSNSICKIKWVCLCSFLKASLKSLHNHV